MPLHISHAKSVRWLFVCLVANTTGCQTLAGSTGDPLPQSTQTLSLNAVDLDRIKAMTSGSQTLEKPTYTLKMSIVVYNGGDGDNEGEVYWIDRLSDSGTNKLAVVNTYRSTKMKGSLNGQILINGTELYTGISGITYSFQVFDDEGLDSTQIQKLTSLQSQFKNQLNAFPMPGIENLPVIGWVIGLVDLIPTVVDVVAPDQSLLPFGNISVTRSGNSWKLSETKVNSENIAVLFTLE